MDTLSIWRYTHPCDGCVTTKDQFTEAEALRIRPDSEDGEQVARCLRARRDFASGLVRREGGVMVQVVGLQIEKPGS